MELDRVVHRKSDQDRQARDHRHGERAAEQRQRAECDGACGQADAQRQQAKRRREDEREHQRHHHERRSQKDGDLALELVGQAVGKDGCARDEIRGVLDLEDIFRDRSADLINRLGALLLGEVGAQANRDCCRFGGREEGRELRLWGRVGEARVEDDGAHELRVADRGELEPEPVLDAERHRLLHELVLDAFRGSVGGKFRLLLAESLLDRSAVGLIRGELGLLLRGNLLLLELLRRLGGELVEECRRPVDDLRGLRIREVVAHLRRLDALGDLALGRGAGQASLEEEDALQVLGEDELLEVALDEDDDRIVAELLLELLGCLERVRALVDERVGLTVRRQGESADHAQDRQQHRERDHGPRALDAPRADACENAPHTQFSLRRQNPPRAGQKRGLTRAQRPPMLARQCKVCSNRFL